MKLNNLGNNKSELKLNNVTVFFSYNTPVAAFISGEGYYKTSEKFSVTTSKHINQWLNGATATVKEQSFFDNLVK